MQTLHFNANSVFAKSAKGRDEVARRSHGLDARQRQTLILIDGTKPLHHISGMIPMPELEKIIPALVAHALVELRAAAAAAAPYLSMPMSGRAASNDAGVINGANIAAPSLPYSGNPAQQDSHADTPVPPLRGLLHQLDSNAPVEMTIRQVKDFMTVTAQTYLGLFGGEVIRQIESASDPDALMAVLGHWHMALHESKQGKRFAGPYLDQVKAALGIGVAG